MTVCSAVHTPIPGPAQEKYLWHRRKLTTLEMNRRNTPSPNHSLLVHSLTLMSFTGTFPVSSKRGHKLQSNGGLDTDIYSKRCPDLLTDHLLISVMMMQSVEFMSL